MHRLVQGQHEEALPVGGEFPLPSSGWRLSRLVEIGLAQRIEKLQVLFPQLKVLLPNLVEWWIRAGIGDRFRVLAKVLLPLCRGILVSEKYGRDHALNQREMTQHPERVAPAIRSRKCSYGATHLVDYTQHCPIRNSHRKLNSLFRLHFLSSWNRLPLSIPIPRRFMIRVLRYSLRAVGPNHKVR